ncbi:MAG: hypothetical protein RLN72_06840 [Henriciella sp.]
MQTFEYFRGPAGTMSVEIHADRIVFDNHRMMSSVIEIHLSELTGLRYYEVESPQRKHFGLALEAGRNKQTVEFVRQGLTGSTDDAAYFEVVRAILGAVHKSRPDQQLGFGVPRAAKIVIFLAFIIPGIGGVVVAPITFLEPSAMLVGLAGLLIGGVSLYFAWKARPWTKRPAIPLSEFLNKLEEDTLTGTRPRQTTA